MRDLFSSLSLFWQAQRKEYYCSWMKATNCLMKRPALFLHTIYSEHDFFLVDELFF